MTRAFICGCSGLALEADEKAFLKDAAPLGVILFKRNVATPDQVRALTAEIRSALGRDDALVLVDQEGGRVQRLGPPHWQRYPAAARFAALADSDERAGAIRLGARLIGRDLKAVGIDVDCAPVLDLPVPGAHDIIGDRAYGKSLDAVARYGRAAADGLLDAGVIPVMKHMPGHGRAGADSHLALPVVDTPRALLEASDFEAFRRNNDLPAAMTAHVVYSDIDPDRPATISPAVIGSVIREAIGFDGLLFSDDISMQALSGTFRMKTESLFAAGVDVALHCNGDRAEAAEVAAATPALAGAAERRVRQARARVGAGTGDFDPVEAQRWIDQVLAATA